MNSKLFSKDFTLVVIGQIISLFGNAAIRFALPLYLLNLTGSSTLYGTVTACAFIPAVLLSPVGGIVADRVNRRNIMVTLDFFTALVILVFSLLMGRVNLVLLLAATMMLLYGIAGAYQPSVQASIPALISQDKYMAANSVINGISALSSLTGPVLGGILYSAWGLQPVLWLCMGCFFLSAVMEIFIQMPFEKPALGDSMWRTVKADFGESLRFIVRDKPAIGKGLLAVCGINLFLSAMINVGLPYLVTEVLDLQGFDVNRLYGYGEGVLAAGGMAGGVCAGALAKRLEIQKSGRILVCAALSVFPVGISLFLFPSGLLNYFVLTVCCFAVMLCATIFSVQTMSFVQAETPQALIGKVISVILTVSMCASPLGSALYGILFEIFDGREFMVVLFSGTVSLGIALGAKNIFKEIR
ncbi:MAG: MFS transporter [Clostridium sp.]|nr:MFS transporter [Clostridium sp.]